MARDLHKPVKSLLKEMDQDELCHWIAFHRIESEKYAEDGKPSKSESPKTEQQKNDDAWEALIIASYC